MKVLTNREMELFHAAVYYAIQYDQSNPNVGMGLHREIIAKRVAKRLSFDIDEDDIAECCELVVGS